MKIRKILSIIICMILFTTIVYAEENTTKLEVTTTEDNATEEITNPDEDASIDESSEADLVDEANIQEETDEIEETDEKEETDPEVLDRMRLYAERFRGSKEMSKELVAMINDSLQGNPMPIDIVINDRYLRSDVDALIIDNRTYVPFRAVVEAFNFTDVSWDGDLYKTSFLAGDQSIELLINTPSIVINGEEFQMDTPTIILEGRTMVPIRFISEVLGFQVEWDNIYYTVSLNHDTYEVNEDQLDGRFYSVEELKTFSKLVYKEAGSVSYETKHGVASVVMNQVRNAYLENTIHGVIYDESRLKHFPPAHAADFEETVPNRDSVLAVKKALRGENSAGACLYFNTSPFKGKTIFKVVDGVYFCY